MLDATLQHFNVSLYDLKTEYVVPVVDSNTKAVDDDDAEYSSLVEQFKQDSLAQLQAHRHHQDNTSRNGTHHHKDLQHAHPIDPARDDEGGIVNVYSGETVDRRRQFRGNVTHIIIDRSRVYDWVPGFNRHIRRKNPSRCLEVRA